MCKARKLKYTLPSVLVQYCSARLTFFSLSELILQFVGTVNRYYKVKNTLQTLQKMKDGLEIRN